MQIILTSLEKEDLEKRHKRERDRRISDRIKAVLLHCEGWSQLQISQALRIRSETVHEHLECYKRSQKLVPENGGSAGRLNSVQIEDLVSYLEEHTYVKVGEICAFVKERYQVDFTISGMNSWLYRHNFSYKQPKATPAKADCEKQSANMRCC